MAEIPWKNRIVGYGDEPIDQVQFNPKNWRVHPQAQQDALSGVLREVGWVQNVIVNKRTGNLVDGHARVTLADRNGEQTVPVTYVDLSEEEEALILASIDPIAAMAATDKQKLEDLLHDCQTGEAGLQSMLAELAEKEKLAFSDLDGGGDGDDIVTDKDDNVLIRLSVNPSVWLGSRDEIIATMEKLKGKYLLSYTLDE